MYSLSQELFDQIPEGLNSNVTGWLVYDSEAKLPVPALVDNFDATFDDFTLVPLDGEKLYEKVDYSVTLDATMENLGDGAN